jgi:hypothetical protein
MAVAVALVVDWAIAVAVALVVATQMVILQSPDIVAVAVVSGLLALAVLATAVVVVALQKMAVAAPGAQQALSLSLSGN